MWMLGKSDAVGKSTDANSWQKECSYTVLRKHGRDRLRRLYKKVRGLQVVDSAGSMCVYTLESL